MLEVKGLVKEYHNHLIFDHFNLKICGPMLLGIIGKTGCGKTTLLNILAGIDENYQGEVLFNGVNILKNSDYYRQHYMCFVTQKSLMLSKWSIKDNLMIEEMLFSRKSELDLELFNALELNINFKQPISSLSGGQIQRLNIVKALNKKPRVLILDEPTSALDLKNSQKVMSLLKEYSQQAIVIIVSHEETLLKEYADEVIDLNQNISTYIYHRPTSLVVRSLKMTSNKFFSTFKFISKSILMRKHRNFLTILSISIASIGVMLTLMVSSGLNDQLIREIKKLFPTQSISLRYKDLSLLIDEQKANQMIDETMLGGYLNILGLEMIGVSNEANKEDYLFIGDQSKLIMPEMTLLKGEMPKNYKEVLVSKNTYERLFLNEEFNHQKIYALYDYQGMQKKVELEVVGIVDEKTTFDTIYRNSLAEVDLIKELYHLEHVQGEFLMLHPKNSVSDTLKAFENKYPDMEFKEVGKDIVEKVKEVIEQINYFLYGLTGIILISVYLLQGMSVYLSVIEKLKEFGLLRLLGLSKKRMLHLQLIEALLMSLLGIIIGIFLTEVFSVQIFNLFDSSLGFELKHDLGILSMILMVLGLLFLSLVSVIYPIMMTKRYQILDLIKENDL